MLKHYIIGGKEWLFEEGKQPDGAIELTCENQAVPDAKPVTKAAKPANKARKAENK